MRRILWVSTFLTLALTIAGSLPAAAQVYSFSLDRLTADVYFEADGTARIDYAFVFTNDDFAEPLDYIDIGVPTSDYSLSSISGWLDDEPVSQVTTSSAVDPGIAVWPARYIQPGETATLRVSIPGVGGMLFRADQPEGYASAQFSPSWFGSEYVHGTSDITVSFHFPPGVQPDEPRWFQAPSGWPEEAPSTGFDDEDRVVYRWSNALGNGYTQYTFGAAFPAQYVPQGAIANPSLFARLGIDEDAVFGLACCGGILAFIAGVTALSVSADRRRRLAYLPPKIAIEGHGIKRGLTAVESAVLLQTPLDRVMTMILFGLVKKGGARVTSEDPLKVEALEPAPELRAYEKAFLTAMAEPEGRKRQNALQQSAVQLVRSVQSSMKGFSLKETREYYKSIMEKAWAQVEQAGTPEVRSEQFADNIEWTMLDDDFDDRTRRTFRTGPVFLPHWWGAYRPSHIPASSGGGKVAAPSRGPSAPSLPHLPGADFAASVVTSVQTTAGKLVSNVTSFTSGVTQVTNPPPKVSYTSSRGGGGFRSGGCACACACAGCACACAGGGR
jgi:hypothetical protein